MGDCIVRPAFSVRRLVLTASGVCVTGSILILAFAGLFDSGLIQGGTLRMVVVICLHPSHQMYHLEDLCMVMRPEQLCRRGVILLLLLFSGRHNEAVCELPIESFFLSFAGQP